MRTSLLAAAIVCALVSAAAAQPGVRITVHTPEPREFVLALDELALATTGGIRSTRRVTAASRQQLADVTRGIEARSPDTEVSWVVYQPGRPRSVATRALLTREIGLLVEDNVRVDDIVGESGTARAIPGVPNGYVLKASDPHAALELAARLRGRPGVRAAYSLVKRQMATR